MRPRHAAVAALVAALAGAAGCAADPGGAAGGAEPHWIVLARDVVTGDPSRPSAGGIAIRAGRITHVGDRDEIRALAGAGTRIDDLGDAVIVPGLADAHGHVLELGLALQRVDLRGATSFDAVVKRIAARAASLPAGTWILGRGWDQTLWPDRVFPEHDALTAAVPDHPVLVNRVDGHAALASGLALAAAGIDEATSDPEGGRILRGAGGRPTGVLIDNAMALVEEVVPPASRQARLDALERALRHLASLGLTAVHDAGVGQTPVAGGNPEPGWETVGLYEELLTAGRLPIRVHVMLGGNGVDPSVQSLFQRPAIHGAGDGLLSVRALKLGVDGALGSRGAALEADYSDDPGNRGLVTREQEALDAIVREAMRRGWQVAIHAIGDRGNRMALDAFAGALAQVPGGRDTRPRIEHAQVLRPIDVARFAELGVIASVQPTHATSDSRWAERRVGPERVRGAYAYRSLASAGARIACGSDFPVEDAAPLAGLRAAVAREGADGRPAGGWRVQEALGPEQALECFTAGAAYAAFMEDEVGRVMPGMRADLTVLDANPLEIDPSRLTEIRVRQTIVGGRVVFQAQ